MSVALLAAFAAGAVPAVFAPQAGAQATTDFYVIGGGGGGSYDGGSGGAAVIPPYGFGGGSGGGSGGGGGGAGASTNAPGDADSTGKDGDTAPGAGGTNPVNSNFNGASANGNDGGAGGHAEEAVSGTASYNNVRVAGGTGGVSGGYGGDGGGGGTASLSVADTLTATTLEITGGNGGGSYSYGSGGDGGNASLTVTNTLTAQQINLTKGSDGSGGGGGGDGSGGVASLTVGTLDVTGNGTNMTLNGTAANNVKFTNVKLGSNRTLTATGTNGGKASITTLTLTGAGNLADSGGALEIGKLHSDGGTLNDTNWDGLVGAGRTYTSTNNITLGTNGLTVDIASDKTLDRKLTGTGGLTKTGSDMLVLSAANDYSGKTQVNEGWLWLENAAATGTGEVELANGTALGLQFDGTYANKITGAGRVITGGFPGYTVILDNAANDYSGGTSVVDNTTLELADPGAAGAGWVDVLGGATLRLSASGIYTNSALQGASGSTLEVMKNDAQVNTISGFENYVFAADALDKNTAALKLTNQGSALTVEANNVSFDVGNAGLVALNDSVTLIESTKDITLTGSAEQTGWLDGMASTLKATVYKLEKAAAGAGAKLEALVSELYLYGTGGTGASTGQRPSGNTLTFDSGEATAAFGGRAVSGKVSGNRVEMSKGTLVKDTTSTNPLAGNLYGGYANAGDATENTVVYSGGTVQGAIYGGYADNGSATNNTVILSNKMSGQTASFDIYGGNTGASGNTLAVQGKGINVASIQNFENLYFILPANTNAKDTMLTVNGSAATQFAQMTNVGVGIAGGGSALQAGDQVTLLTNPVGLHNASGGELVQGTDYQLVTTGTQGFSLSHNFELSNDANSLNATVKTPPSPPPQPQPTPPQPKPQPTPEPEPVPPKPEPVPPKPQPVPPAPQVDPRTKAVPESRVAVMGMLNLGSDQIVRMTGNLPSSTGGGAPNFGGSGVSPNTQTPDDATAFADISVHRQKIETGSHVNVNGAAAIVGAAKAIPLAGGGTAAVGAFFEYGDGSFKTHNGFDTGDVNGKGNSDYYGAGVLARVNLAGKDNGAPFVEGSVHAGRIHNNWHTDDLRDAATGARAQYDIRTPYMGGHVGAGYRWQTNDTTQVEVFGQYLYTHMDGKETTVALDPYSFRAVKSSRSRIGAKGTWAVSQQTQAYAGAAWEREFDGTARATAYSFDVPAPTMKGNSAVIDAGLSFQPRQNLTTNVGVTGYAGKRKGAAANVEVQYLF